MPVFSVGEVTGSLKLESILKPCHLDTERAQSVWSCDDVGGFSISGLLLLLTPPSPPLHSSSSLLLLLLTPTLHSSSSLLLFILLFTPPPPPCSTARGESAPLWAAWTSSGYMDGVLNPCPALFHSADSQIHLAASAAFSAHNLRARFNLREETVTLTEWHA